MPTHKLLKAVWSGDVTLIGHDAAPAVSNPEAPASATPLVSLEGLKKKYADDLARKMAYVVVAFRRAHLSRGMRRPIERLVTEVAKRREDAKPPSSSTVMTWMRSYAKEQQAPQSLVTGNAQRVRSSALHPEMDRVLTAAIHKFYLTRDRFSLRHTLAMAKREANAPRSCRRIESGGQGFTKAREITCRTAVNCPPPDALTPWIGTRRS